MEKIICSKIQYAFSFEVEQVLDNQIELKPGYSFKQININNAVYSRSSDDADAGRLLIEKLEVKGSINFTDFKFLSYYPVVLQLQTHDGEFIAMGNTDTPARFDSGFNRNNHCELTFKRASCMLKS